MGAVKNHFHDVICAQPEPDAWDYAETYRGYQISPSLVSYMPASDWCFAHEDYDGAPDGNDTRCGYAASPEACREEIDMLEDE